MACSDASLAVLAGNRYVTLGFTLKYQIRIPQSSLRQQTNLLGLETLIRETSRLVVFLFHLCEFNYPLGLSISWTGFINYLDSYENMWLVGLA